MRRGVTSIAALVCVGVILVSVNVIAARFPAVRVDMTQGKLYTLSRGTRLTLGKIAEPITLRVYAGADGQFKLYEDDGLTYGYEKGAFARTPITWNDATRTLSIGKREGSFPGMVTERTFNVVLVSPDRATGYSATPTPVATIRYNGAAVETRLP